jgi:hypothetical protein
MLLGKFGTEFPISRSLFFENFPNNQTDALTYTQTQADNDHSIAEIQQCKCEHVNILLLGQW